MSAADIPANKPIAFGDANSITLYQEDANTPVNKRIQDLLTSYNIALRPQQLLADSIIDARQGEDGRKKAAERVFTLYYGKLLSQLLLDLSTKNESKITYQQFLDAVENDSTFAELMIPALISKDSILIARNIEETARICRKVWNEILNDITV